MQNKRPFEKLVLSASRRTELLGFQERFLDALNRYPPDRVHSIVLWTKTPYLLFRNDHKKLLKRLLEYDQIYAHVTITGLGSSFLESNIPPYQDTIDLLPRLIDVVKSPKRINIRFDPVLNLVHKNGKIVCNLALFPKIAALCKDKGVTEFTFSWMTAYKKVRRRLGKLGFEKFEAEPALKEKQAEKLNAWAKAIGIHLKGCCTQPFFPAYGCINGRLLTQLHPNNEKCTLEKPTGQRELCVCTKSRDIGWYYSCPNGCSYCYGQPKFNLAKSLELMKKTNCKDYGTDAKFEYAYGRTFVAEKSGSRYQII